MYQLAVYFDVPPKRHQDFIDAALEDSRESGREPGTIRIDLIQDKASKNRFYLNEAYDDEAAFNDHKCGPHFKRFFSIIDEFAMQGPHLLERTLIEDPAAAATTHE